MDGYQYGWTVQTGQQQLYGQQQQFVDYSQQSYVQQQPQQYYTQQQHAQYQPPLPQSQPPPPPPLPQQSGYGSAHDYSNNSSGYGVHSDFKKPTVEYKVAVKPKENFQTAVQKPRLAAVQRNATNTTKPRPALAPKTAAVAPNVAERKSDFKIPKITPGDTASDDDPKFKYCDLCHLNLHGRKHYEMHIVGDVHKEKLKLKTDEKDKKEERLKEFEGDYVNGVLVLRWCPICQGHPRKSTVEQDWFDHIKTQEHKVAMVKMYFSDGMKRRKVLKVLRIDDIPYDLENDLADLQDDTTYSDKMIIRSGVLNNFKCRLCNVTLDQQSWKEHAQADDHARACLYVMKMWGAEEFYAEYSDLPIPRWHALKLALRTILAEKPDDEAFKAIDEFIKAKERLTKNRKESASCLAWKARNADRLQAEKEAKEKLNKRGYQDSFVSAGALDQQNVGGRDIGGPYGHPGGAAGEAGAAAKRPRQTPTYGGQQQGAKQQAGGQKNRQSRFGEQPQFELTVVVGRQVEIENFKQTAEYINYSCAEQPTTNRPMTPDPTVMCNDTTWTRQVDFWKKRIAQLNNPYHISTQMASAGDLAPAPPPVASSEREMDPTVLERRQRDIKKAKDMLVGYPIYLQQIPKEQRTPECPRTPDITCKYTRKEWLTQLSDWKKAIHQWDPPEVQQQFAKKQAAAGKQNMPTYLTNISGAGAKGNKRPASQTGYGNQQQHAYGNQQQQGYGNQQQQYGYQDFGTVNRGGAAFGNPRNNQAGFGAAGVGGTEMETDVAVIERKAKQVEMAKLTILGYARYAKEIPKEERGPGRPTTPDVMIKQSRKDFAKTLSDWKKALHAWDPPECQEAFKEGKTLKEQQEMMNQGDVSMQLLQIKSRQATQDRMIEIAKERLKEQLKEKEKVLEKEQKRQAWMMGFGTEPPSDDEDEKSNKWKRKNWKNEGNYPPDSMRGPPGFGPPGSGPTGFGPPGSGPRGSGPPSLLDLPFGRGGGGQGWDGPMGMGGPMGRGGPMGMGFRPFEGVGQNNRPLDFGGPGLGCMKCGADDHISSRCPTNKGINTSRTSCFQCGQDGHFSRDCPNPKVDDSAKQESDSCVMFLRNLSFEADEDMLWQAFPCAKHIRVPIQPDGKIRGFAFIEFGSTEEVVRTIAENRGLRVAGREVFLEVMGKKSDQGSGREKGSCFRCGEKGHASGDCPYQDQQTGKRESDACVMFVKNLSFEANEDMLWEFFPNARHIRLPIDSDGKIRGFGFVEFGSAEEVVKTIGENRGLRVAGREVFLEVMGQKKGQGKGGGGQGFPRGNQGGGGRPFGREEGGRGRVAEPPQNKPCYKCGEEGHKPDDCVNLPLAFGSSGGGGTCFKCGEEGHLSRDCTAEPPKKGPSRQRAPAKEGGNSCFKCGETGHFSRECPNAGNSAPAQKKGRIGCLKCGQEGHFSRDCPNHGAGGGVKCPECGDLGHTARLCPYGENAAEEKAEMAQVIMALTKAQKVHQDVMISRALASLNPGVHMQIMRGQHDAVAMTSFAQVRVIIEQLRGVLGESFEQFLQVGELADQITRLEQNMM